MCTSRAIATAVAACISALEFLGTRLLFGRPRRLRRDDKVGMARCHLRRVPAWRAVERLTTSAGGRSLKPCVDS